VLDVTRGEDNYEKKQQESGCSCIVGAREKEMKPRENL
jgi:hypothetical protein